jgi:RNA recognition motif-containing protein
MSTQDNNTVYISNLSYNRDRQGIKSMFSSFGQIKTIKIIVEPSTNQSRGMAFVEMTSAIAAKKAIEGLDQRVFDGRTVKAKYATPLKNSSRSRIPEKKNEDKDLEYVSKQLAKKARNLAKRKSNPLVFKLPQTSRA